MRILSGAANPADLSMIEARNLSMVYPDGTEALRDLNLVIHRGASCSIIGPSGCGKTTLLFILAGLLKPTKGQVLLGAREIVSPARGVALILQDYGLFPWKTVYENVALGLKLQGMRKRERRAIVMSLLKELGLKEFANHYPKQLSGGMQQRVGFARALALKPAILLMDEPLSSLDALTRETLQNFLLSLWKNNGMTMVLVTHSIEEAVFLGREIIVLSRRPGHVVKIVENFNAGDENYRSKEAFFAKCREVRMSIEHGAI